MSIVICPHEVDQGDNNIKIFLAGPVQGAPNWQNTMPEIPGITWLSPRRENFDYTKTDAWEEQYNWETEHLRGADFILFWIPEEEVHIEGRDYAQTTRTEFGEYLALGKNIIAACHEKFPGRRYLERKLKQYYGPETVMYKTLDELILKLKECIK